MAWFLSLGKYSSFSQFLCYLFSLELEMVEGLLGNGEGNP